MNCAGNLCGAMLLLLACAASSPQENPAEAQKPAGLYGLVTNSLTGEPLAHVEVWLLRRISGRFSSYRYTVTGPDGRFSLSGIEAAAYFVSAERNGYHRIDVLPPDDPPMLSLKPGEEIKDIVFRLEPDAVIGGKVVGADGAPMEHVKVEAIGRAGWGFNTTDDRGEFLIGGLLPGEYLLRVSCARRSPEIRKDGSVAANYDVTYFPNARTASSAMPFKVRAAQQSNIEIKMVPAPVLHISGDVLGMTGGRAPGINLESEWDDPRTGDINEKGAFTFPLVPAGRYRLYAEDGAGHKSAPVLIDLTNASIEGIHLALSPNVGISGRIRDEDWSRMKTLINQQEHKDGGPEIILEQFGFFPPQVIYRSTLSDDGRFTIKEVDPGRYLVTMTGKPKDFYLRSVQIGEREFHDGILEIGGGPILQKMLIELGFNGAEVSGVVGDEKGGVNKARVILLAQDGSFSAFAGDAYTSEDGSYVIHGIAPGRYKLFALNTKYKRLLRSDEALELDRNVTEEIELHAGDRITLNLRMGAQ